MQETRQSYLECLARENARWERAHANYLRTRLSADHEDMTTARVVINHINMQLDAMDKEVS